MAKTRGPSAKAYYAAYKSQNKYATNKRKKLERTLKAQPNNEQVVIALKNIKYKRKTPGSPTWSHTKKATAAMFKQVVGKVNIDVFSNNDATRNMALVNLKTKFSNMFPNEKVSFKLGARAHNKSGELVWN